MVVPARMLAAATLATTVLCLILAVVQVSHLPATRTEALDLGYQYVDPQAQLGVTTHPVQLPQYSAMGTNHAFLGQYDGDGQSTSDVAREEQLAQRTVAMAKHVKKAKKAHKPWKPMAANQLFKFKGVHFKGFNKQKAAMYQKMRQAHKLQPSHTQMKYTKAPNEPKRLWPESPIAGANGPEQAKPNMGMQKARPVQQNDMPVGPMGTNNVFLGSHQGGDSSFSHPGGH